LSHEGSVTDASKDGGGSATDKENASVAPVQATLERRGVSRPWRQRADRMGLKRAMLPTTRPDRHAGGGASRRRIRPRSLSDHFL